MNLENLKKQLQSKFLETDEITIIDTRNDQSHIEIQITSEKFQDLTRIQRHQYVYEIINPYLNDGSLHAVKMKLTPKSVKKSK